MKNAPKTGGKNLNLNWHLDVDSTQVYVTKMQFNSQVGLYGRQFSLHVFSAFYSHSSLLAHERAHANIFTM